MVGIVSNAQYFVYFTAGLLVLVVLWAIKLRV
jgi:hypothetical protein